MCFNKLTLFLTFELTFSTCSQFFMTPLRNFTCPGVTFNCYPWLFDVSESLYPKRFTNRNLPPFPHLDKIFSHFQSHHCFTMITLFQNADFVINVQPIILRRPEAVVLWWYHENMNSWNSYFMLKWELREKARTTNITGKCDKSKFWSGYQDATSFYYHNNHEVCILLNFHNFTINTKPWNCQLDLGLHPPSFQYSYDTINYPKVFMHSPDRYILPHNINPSPIPKIHIYHELNKTSHNALSGWIETLSRNREYQKVYENDVFILIRDDYATNSSQLNNIVSFQVCSICPPYIPFEFTELNMTTFSTSVLTGKGERQEKLRYWSIFKDGRSEFYDNVAKEISKCENLKTTSHNLIFSQETRIQQVEYAYATVWTSLMGNYTYISDVHNKQCTNGKLVDKIISIRTDIATITFRGTRHLQYNTGRYLYPVDLPNLVDRLKFVSCGERGFTSLAFGELLGVFDHNVWIMLVISVFAVACSLFGLISGSTEFLTSILLTLSKILVEQGNPFSGRFVNNKKLRIILAIYLLVCVVISNAYKNRNIYKMIKSREILQFERFSELMDANFSIYVRATLIDFSVTWQEYIIPGNFQFDVAEHSIYMYAIGIFSYGHIFSEISSLTYVVRTLVGIQNYLNISSQNSKDGNVTLGELHHGTRLHPQLHSLVVTDAVRNISSKYADNYSYVRHNEIRSNMRLLLKEGELRLFDDSLRMCNRTAVILPENVCRKFANDLRADGYQYVFVGKELYSSSVAIAFSLKGFVPRYILRRIQGIQSSGIWERWSTFAKGNDVLGSMENVPQGASMQGNIFIVFLLYLVGNALSVTLFSSEILYIKLVKLENHSMIHVLYV